MQSRVLSNKVNSFDWTTNVYGVINDAHLNLNSSDTISIPISFRHPAFRANWTKVMDLDGMNHQSKSNHPHQSATYSSNPGHYSSKVHVK